MDEGCGRLILKIERLRSLLQSSSSKIRAFGADVHRWQFHPPISIARVLEFENRVGVTLPSAYRDFLVQISSGGAGPAYGLIFFDGVSQHASALDVPFPWVKAHNPYDGGPDPSDEIHDAQANGTIAICDEGCGYLHRLVVNGDARGSMWIDSRVSDGGFIPLNVDFATWYERWLDEVLAGRDGSWWLASGPTT
jgi:hypothetical protein